MILYIRALGFSQFDTKTKAELMVSDIIKSPTDKFVWESENKILNVEYYKAYGDDFGLMIRGTVDQQEELNVSMLMPYTLGNYLTNTHEVDVVKHESQEVYYGFCEELRSGTPISFFVQNLVDYKMAEKHEQVYVKGVHLITYCAEGTIILPIDKDDTDLLLEQEEENIREELLEQARRGDEEAMSILDDEANEATEILQERLMNEDILSVLEGFFVPVGDDDDIYSILGDVEEIQILHNEETNEEIYRMKIKCMAIPLDVFINSKDLVGYPTLGMRFKGTGWVHGKIEFDYEKHDS
jgi:hypothetical protein